MRAPTDEGLAGELGGSLEKRRKRIQAIDLTQFFKNESSNRSGRLAGGSELYDLDQATLLIHDAGGNALVSGLKKMF